MDKFPHSLVKNTDKVIGMGHDFPHFWGIGEVGWNGCFCGVVSQLQVFFYGFGVDIVGGAFVGDHKIDHGEKRLSFSPVSPMGLIAAIIPTAFGTEVIICFDIIGGIVAIVPEDFGQDFQFIGQGYIRTEMLGTQGSGIHAGNQRRAGRGTDGGV